MRAGHGPGVYGYGWSWFVRCLRALDAAEATESRRARLDRAGRMVDMRMAMHGDKDSFLRRFETLTQE